MANKNCASEIPEDVMGVFAKALLPETRAFYESKEGKNF